MSEVQNEETQETPPPDSEPLTEEEFKPSDAPPDSPAIPEPDTSPPEEKENEEGDDN